MLRSSGPRDYFEGLYKLNPDPFSNEVSRYDREKRELLLTMIAKRHHRRGLDAGCGTGMVSRALAAHCNAVVGVDFSSEAVRRARELTHDSPTVTFAEVDFANAKPAGTFDVVVCSEVLYYMDGERLDAAIANIRASCDADAWLFIALPVRHEKRVLAHVERQFVRRERTLVRNWRRSYTLTRWEPLPA